MELSMTGGSGNSDDTAIRECEKKRSIMRGVPVIAYIVYSYYTFLIILSGKRNDSRPP